MLQVYFHCSQDQTPPAKIPRSAPGVDGEQVRQHCAPLLQKFGETLTYTVVLVRTDVMLTVCNPV